MEPRIVRRGVALGAAFAFLFLAAAPAGAAGVEIPAVRDATLFADPEGALASGSGPYFFAGNNAGSSTRRALVKFAVADRIPLGARVTEAVLALELCRNNAGAEIVSLHRVTADWGESTSSSPGGAGAPSSAGDATWIHTYFDRGFWSRPGGDFVASSASALVDGLGPYEWGSTSAMVADVQAWVDDPGRNHGWLLLGKEFGPSTVKGFCSREDGDVAARPVLRVKFDLGDDEGEDEGDDERRDD